MVENADRKKLVTVPTQLLTDLGRGPIVTILLDRDAPAGGGYNVVGYDLESGTRENFVFRVQRDELREAAQWLTEHPDTNIPNRDRVITGVTFFQQLLGQTEGE